MLQNFYPNFSYQFAQTDSVDSLAVQVKLLMEIPEKIWTCIEAEDFVKATQLFIMARHVNTGMYLYVMEIEEIFIQALGIYWN